MTRYKERLQDLSLALVSALVTFIVSSAFILLAFYLLHWIHLAMVWFDGLFV